MLTDKVDYDWHTEFIYYDADRDVCGIAGVYHDADTKAGMSEIVRVVDSCTKHDLGQNADNPQILKLVEHLKAVAQRHDWEGQPSDSTVSQSPFVKYRSEILADYGTAIRLQELVRNLYNDDDWRVRMGSLLANADERHKRIVLEILDWYWQHGENDAEFVKLARYLASGERSAR